MVPRASSSAVPPSPREHRRERERVLRREDILAAASQVFAEKGFHDAQVSQIATRAEVSLASVYQYFESKESMFEAVVSGVASAIDIAIRQRVEGVADPSLRLLAVGDAMFDCFEQNRDLLRIYARATQGVPWRASDELGGRTKEISHDFTAWVVSLARDAEREGALRGLDPEVFAATLVGAVMTVAMRAVESDDAGALVELAPRLRAIFARVFEGLPS